MVSNGGRSCWAGPCKEQALRERPPCTHRRRGRGSLSLLFPSLVPGTLELWESPSGFDSPNLEAPSAGETQKDWRSPPLIV